MLSSMDDKQAVKVRENRLRQAAKRQGLVLRKNPRRDPQALDYGSYVLIDASNNAQVADFGWDYADRSRDHLADVEAWLQADHDQGR